MSHQTIEEMLPWYANDTLPGEERRRVEDHLAECAECARELKSVHALRMAVIESVEAIPAPSEDGLERLMDRIEAYEVERSPAAAVSVAPRLSERLRGVWAALWNPPSPALARVAIAAQFIVIVALVAALAVGGDSSPSEFGTAAGPAVVETPGASTLRVGFRPEATESEIREALRSIGGTIVDGPSAAGLYTVAVPAGDPASLDAALGALQGDGAVRYAEPVEEDGL